MPVYDPGSLRAQNLTPCTFFIQQSCTLIMPHTEKHKNVSEYDQEIPQLK